ncbi:insulinase family protein [Candidatus Fermentibacteria bacterium]|nr:insulinase family protein [Candidatus Fermentibacteria bacterium]
MSRVSATLPNGLEVLVERVGLAPVAAVVAAYRAGSGLEGPHNRGYSHFLEHMLFKGTRRRTSSEFWQIIQRDGGIANAYTARDATAYFEVVPASRLEDVLDLEADRMCNALLDPDDIASERSVVLEERRTSCVDSPSGALDEALHLAAFDRHPVRHPILGYESDISAFEEGPLRRHYEEFYSPGNAFLVVAGGVDPGEVMRAVERFFSRIPPGAGRRKMETSDPATGLRTVTLEHPSNLPRLSVAWRAPAGTHEDWPLLDMAATWLAAGRSSRLEELLVQTGAALSVSASLSPSAGPGLFAVRATLSPGTDSDEVLGIIERETEALASEPLTEKQMEEIRVQHRSVRIISSSGPAGLAGEVSLGLAMFGDPRHHEKMIERIDRTGAEDLARACRRWLDPGERIVARLVPTGVRSRPEAPGIESAVREDVAVPDDLDLLGVEIPGDMLKPPSRSISEGCAESVLENGMRVLLLEDRTFPTACVAFATGIASEEEPEGLEGLADVTVESMHYGTEDQRYVEFNGRLEKRGANLDFTAGAEHSQGSIMLVGKDLKEAVSFVSDLLARPAFREEDVARVVEEKLVALGRRRESPFSVAVDELWRLTSDPPSMAGIPSEESVRSITPDAVREFHRASCRPSRTTLAVVGRFDRRAVLATIEEAFGSWAEPDGPPPVTRCAAMPRDPAEIRITMEGRTQSALLLAVPAPPMDHPDSPAIALANAVLGDGMSSRLGAAVRERRGLAYEVGSEVIATRSRGRLLVYLATSGNGTDESLALVRSELARMASEGVTEAELRLAAASILSKHTMALMDYEPIAGYLAECSFLGRPLSYDVSELSRMSALTPADVTSACSRWMKGPQFACTAGPGE